MLPTSLRLTGVLAIALLCMIGCSRSDTDSAKDAAADTKAVAGEAGEEAADAVASGFEAIKGAYVETVRGTLDEFGKQIDAMVARKDSYPEPIKVPLEKPLSRLSDSYNDASNMLSTVENATEDEFEDARAEMDLALEDLKASISELAARF